MWTDRSLRLASLAVLAALVGCGQESEPVPGVRWIEADPQRTIDRSSFVSTETVVDLTPSRADADQWQTWGDLSVEFKGRRAVLTLAGRWGGLSRGRGCLRGHGARRPPVDGGLGRSGRDFLS